MSAVSGRPGKASGGHRKDAIGLSIIGLSMATLPCCAAEDVEAGSAALRVDWPFYPRRAEHNTVAEGGNRRSTIAASSQIKAFALAALEELIGHLNRAARRSNRDAGTGREGNHGKVSSFS